MAQTPEQTGNSNRGVLWLKKTAAATYMYLTICQDGNASRLWLFGALAVFVPPPLGIISATAAVAALSLAQASGRSLARAFREANGYAHPGDFDILGEFNRLQREAPRQFVPLPRHQKTVFPGFEIR